ncbi:MAG: sigma 54-interacting transcriptional regulator [Pseudomonadota bacterium]|nr:sigma 54-interacting transcriptional regulator [Pseudomonadota bacterium]
MTATSKKRGPPSGMDKAVALFGETFGSLVALRMRAAVAAALAEIALVPHPWPKPVFQRLARGIAKAVSLYLQTNAVGTSLGSGTDPNRPNGLSTMMCVTLGYEHVGDSWEEGKRELVTDLKAGHVNLVVPATQVTPCSRIDVGYMELSIYLDRNIPEELSTLLQLDLHSQLVEAGLALGLSHLRPRADWKTRPPSTITEVLWDVRIRMSVFVTLFLELYREEFRFPDPFLIFLLEPRRLGRGTLQGLQTYARSGFLGYSYLIDDGQREYLTEKFPEDDPNALKGDMALPFPDGICGAVFLQGTDSEPVLAAEVIGTYEDKNIGVSAVERRMLQDRVLLELPIHVADIEALSPDGPELILAIAVPLSKPEPEALENNVSLATPLDEKVDKNNKKETNPERIERLSRSPYPTVFKPGELQILREVSRRLINEFVRTPAVPASDDVLLGKSSVMRVVVSNALVLAQTKRPILILGPAGSGKTQLARHIHFRSTRNKKNFKITSGASFSQELGRSELFGYMKDSHNQAHKDTPGILEDADGGTLFIDDFDVLPPDVQAMLLAVMEGGEFRRIGENAGKSRKADVRFILATNADLNDLIAKGMRRDFLTRLAGCVTMPPLDGRREDIPELVRYFVKAYIAEQRDTIPELDIHVQQDVVDMLCDNDWSDGEVRALRYTVEMACTKLLSDTSTTPSKKTHARLVLRPQEVHWALGVQPPRARNATLDSPIATMAPVEINANSAALGAGLDVASRVIMSPSAAGRCSEPET